MLWPLTGKAPYGEGPLTGKAPYGEGPLRGRPLTGKANYGEGPGKAPCGEDPLRGRPLTGKALYEGRVTVDGQVATSNFKVFEQAQVVLDGMEVPAPGPEPKLWAMNKPRKVLCEPGPEKSDGTETLRRRMRRWYEKEMTKIGKAVGEGLEEESLKDKHWVIATGLAYASDGLVLLTNDGIFAETLASAESNVLTAYDVKIQGDPPIDLLHKWRTGARAGGVKYGRVWCSMTKRTGATAKLRVNGRRDKTAASVGQYERLWARIKVFWMMGVLLAELTSATAIMESILGVFRFMIIKRAAHNNVACK
ncbi:unnamed protein product [Symbiodinium natans]|uniref:Uncharacterized protein n=1 Tax=Symbiodinium natans TaxID=878477 RepID=A0A812NT93_9DINO|nr:unnamed protein product [Symbiodinium natans]